jgi:hypothetical protein
MSHSSLSSIRSIPASRIRAASLGKTPLPGNLTDTLVEWLRGRIDTEGLAGLDELDDPLEFLDFTPWDDEAYW